MFALWTDFYFPSQLWIRPKKKNCVLYLYSCRTSATTIYINFLSSALRDANTSFRFDFTVWHVLYQFMSMMFFFLVLFFSFRRLKWISSWIFFLSSLVGCSFILLRFGYIILFSLNRVHYSAKLRHHGIEIIYRNELNQTESESSQVKKTRIKKFSILDIMGHWMMGSPLNGRRDERFTFNLITV